MNIWQKKEAPAVEEIKKVSAINMKSQARYELLNEMNKIAHLLDLKLESTDIKSFLQQLKNVENHFSSSDEKIPNSFSFRRR
jgi:hypothetical protein